MQLVSDLPQMDGTPPVAREHPSLLALRRLARKARHAARLLLPLLPLLLPVMLLLPGLNSFSYPSAEASYSDVVISHYPNALFLRSSLFEQGILPLWSPGILGGYPFAANPLSGLWYPGGWPALFLPLPLGFNLLVILHLVWGGLGMVLLLRREGLSHPAALYGSLAFEALPKLFAHYGAGHLTLLYAVPWTPWLLLSIHSNGNRANPSAKVLLRHHFNPSIVLALIFLADPRWAAYAGVLWLAYAVARRSGPILPFLGSTAVQVAIACLLSAPLALPLLEYTSLSSRALMEGSDILTYSLPPARLLGLVFPEFGGFHEWILYSGMGILTLSLLAVLWKPAQLRGRFWIGIALISLVFSLGSAIPLLPLIAQLPGFDLLRVPSRAFFLTGFSLAVLAAHGLDHLIAGAALGERRKAGLLLVGLAAFVLFFSGALWMVTSRLPLNFAWAAVFALALVLWIGVRLRDRIRLPVWLWVLFGLCLLDWIGVDQSLFAPRSQEKVFSEGRVVAAYLAAQPGRFRVYSPSYSLPQQAAMQSGLELADGVDPLQLLSYANYMERATGVPRSGYSVTLPPFAGGDPAVDNAIYRPDPALLGLLNVRYLVSEYDMPVEGLRQAALFGETRVYRNELALPRAWVQPLDSEWGTGAVPVESLSWTPNAIRMDVAGPGLLVLSEIIYPGWQAWVDGNRVEIQPLAGLLRSIPLGPGSHQVSFVFHPLSIYLGLVLWAGGMLFIVILFLRRERG